MKRRKHGSLKKTLEIPKG